MLLKALIDRGLSQEYFTLINQAPPVGATSIQEKKIDAHADFCPWGELLEFRGWGRKILDGSDTKIPYLHGVVVRHDFAERYPEIVVAYLKAVIEAGEWVTKNPQEAAKAMQEWATINKEIMYLYFGPGGFLTLDTTMKPRWIETLKYNVTVLQKMEIIKQMDVDAWMNDTYLKQAYKETGRDYDQQLAVTSIATSPVSGTDPITGQPVADPRLAGEIWTAEDCILTYSSPVSLLVALRTLEQQGKGIQAAYAFDYSSGLKLFANQAFYVLTVLAVVCQPLSSLLPRKKLPKPLPRSMAGRWSISTRPSRQRRCKAEGGTRVMRSITVSSRLLAADTQGRKHVLRGSRVCSICSLRCGARVWSCAPQQWCDCVDGCVAWACSFCFGIS